MFYFCSSARGRISVLILLLGLVSTAAPSSAWAGQGTGQGVARGDGSAIGSLAVSGSGTVEGSGIVVYQNHQGRLQVKQGSGSASGHGVAIGQGSAHGSGIALGRGTAQGQGRLRALD